MTILWLCEVVLTGGALTTEASERADCFLAAIPTGRVVRKEHVLVTDKRGSIEMIKVERATGDLQRTRMQSE